METNLSNTAPPNRGDQAAPGNPEAGNPERPTKTGKTGWLGPALLLIFLAVLGGGLAVWKADSKKKLAAAAAQQPEQMESITTAVAQERQHRRTTSAIGTVVALRSISLRNELPGTVREVRLNPGEVVEAGTLLVALDVSVEEAELRSLEAEAALARTLLQRMERAVQSRATAEMELDRARAQLDVAQAQKARIQAIIARKTIRAPFRARVGISDVHPGQYLNEGTSLTTLQGVEDGVHVDFSVPQQVAEQLKPGDPVEVFDQAGEPAPGAEVVALDARVNPATRSIMVRAKVAGSANLPAPGGSVRVRVPSSVPISAVGVPVTALRKGPSGDHVFVIEKDAQGNTRALMRRAQVGAVLGDQVLLLSGVAAGDQVAADGSFKLRDKALVVVAPVRTATAD